MPDPIHAAAADAGPWDGAALSLLRTWDPAWADACNEMATNPWRSGVLSRKFVELVSVGLAVACTNLDVQATRRHMRAALAAGATRSEILFVIKCATVVSLHSCSVAAPIAPTGGAPSRRPTPSAAGRIGSAPINRLRRESDRPGRTRRPCGR
ncbi:carboxymuconolactone decarboxylase family protein [Nocardia albiluteola]